MGGLAGVAPLFGISKSAADRILDHLTAGLRQFLDAGDSVYRGRIENRIRHRNGPPSPMGA
jgi:hypothetical protein